MATETVLTLDGKSFDLELGRKEGGPLLVDFWAEWCGPCRIMGPVVEKLAERFKGSARVGKVDVDQNQALAARYGVLSIPTLLLFMDGQVVEQVVGTTTEDNLARMIERHRS